MPEIKSKADIAAHLDRAEALRPNDLDGAHQVIGTLMSKWPNERGIYVQLQRLADFITKTKQELSALRPDEMKQNFILKAADELDAIVEGTASATHRIMDAADAISELTAVLDQENGAKLMNAVTSIYEACTFQDITGQRVTKVVSMLKVIEDRIDNMVIAMGEMEPVVEPASGDPKGKSDGGSELHGPALPGQGVSQSEIDKLFAGDGE